MNSAIRSTGKPDLADRLSKYDVPYARVLESTWLRDVLSWILPAVAFFGVWFFLFRRFAEKQGMGGFLNIGKSRAKVFGTTAEMALATAVNW